MNPKRKNIVVFTANSWVSPLVSLRVTGPAEQAGFHAIQGNDGEDISPELVLKSDLVVIQRDFPRYWNSYQEIYRLARSSGKPIIYDLDDLLLELPEDHPDRLSLHYGEALLPMLQAVIEADHITTTTMLLCEYLKLFNPNVSVLPNYLNDRIWNLNSFPVHKDNKQPITIGYMGGASHVPDLAAVAPVLVKIAHRYADQVVFRFLGAHIPVDLSSLPNVVWSPSETYDYAKFAGSFSNQEYDIFIAPLCDNLFNRCKSPIKYLEFSAQGAPGVYSNLDAYSCVVRHGENGFLASGLDEWLEYITRLIESPELRFEMGQQALETVRANWLLSQHADCWVQVYDCVSKKEHANQVATQPETAALLRLFSQVQFFEREISAREKANEYKAGQLTQLTGRLHELTKRLQQFRESLERTELESQSLKWRLLQIEQSRSWRLLIALGNIRKRPTSILGTIARIVSASWRGLLRLLSPRRIAPTQLFPNLDMDSEEQNAASLQLEGFPEGLESARALRKPGKYDVIVLAVMDWHTRLQRPQQIAHQFAKAGHRVFYVNTGFRDEPVPLVTHVGENIYEVYLSSPHPANIYRDAIDEPMQQAFCLAFDFMQQAFKITHAACLVDLPFWTPLAQSLKRIYGWKIVYDCMDYHRGFSSNAEPMLSLEDTLVTESDLVLVTSQILHEAISPQNPNCLLVPNGADYDHFRYPILSRPVEIVNVSKPIIGYYGAIADWFDSDLIRSLALARTDWQFVLIGSTLYADLEPLEGLPNVLLLGEKPYQDLPQYLHTFDVGIIPFKRNQLTQATNPVKLFEYLSAGKAVVATNLDELHRYKIYARLASSPEEWLIAIEEALKDYSHDKIQGRLSFARQNTWKQRFAQTESAISSLYSKVSVIVLTFNNLDYTRLCLTSIYEKTDYPNYEVVVVDNASSDGTREFLQEFVKDKSNIHLSLNSANEGFARGNNIGATIASGDILVFLNNDTVITRDWLKGLVRYLRNLDIGLVGPVTNWSGNETRIPVDYSTIKEMDNFAERYTSEHAGKSFEIRMLPFLCVAMRRSLFEEVGPLDENFGIGMFEDDDYALRVKAKGYRVICAEDIFIHHWGKASFSIIDSEKVQRLFEENQRKFESKWGKQWELHENR
jgi:GT2 family glycosyltransferase/glycosyltransferase involved in cell wall biosynthesis